MDIFMITFMGPTVICNAHYMVKNENQNSQNNLP